MKNDFRLAINQICNQRQLPKEVVIEAIEVALASAYKKNFGSNQEIEVKIDPDTGKARVFIVRRIVDEVTDPRIEISLAEARKLDAMAEVDGVVSEETTPRDFGRIAAQTAKQVILQRIREAERDITYGQYIDRAGEIISGSVRNIDDRGNVIISLGKAEAILQRSERIRSEHYQHGQRLRTYVIDVEKTSRGPQIMVSRTHRQFLKRLLELEVPEIFNGTVEIKAIAREPGSRSKVAVVATQEGIDPVGSCVGVRGVRIQNVVTELSGEKIDIVCWDPDPGIFVANALSPSRVADVLIDDDSNTATVIVPDNQLSLAIGKEGQNARLAAKLTGWRIDIKSVSEAAVEAERRAEAEAAAAAETARLKAAREEALALIEQAESLIAEEEAAEALVTEQAMADDEATDVEEAPEPAAQPLEEVSTAEAAAEPAILESWDVPEIAVETEILADMQEDTLEQAAPEPIEEEAGLAGIEPEELVVPAIQDIPEEAAVWDGEEGADEPDEEDEDRDRQKKLSKRQRRQKRWQLVMDEGSGEVVAQRRRKRRGGDRQRDWEDTDWER